MTHYFGLYSVKGGSTRTTLAANLAAELLNKDPKMRIGLVDGDVEGAGMDIFLATALAHRVPPDEEDKKLLRLSQELESIYAEELTGTLVDVLGNKHDPEKGTYWLDARRIIGLRTPASAKSCVEGLGDRLWLMPCGRDWRKLAGLKYSQHGIKRLRRLMKRMSKEKGLDHVFVDCRSGIADSALAGALSVDCIVMPLVASNAHLQGVVDGTRVLQEATAKCDVFPQELHYVVSKMPKDESERHTVAEAIGGFFDQSLFYPSVCKQPASFIPFHQAMTLAEAIPCLSGTAVPGDDQAFRTALMTLWQSLQERMNVPAGT